MNDFKTGISVASSWAWGTSLILGMEIARTKGIPIFVLWAIANTLTLFLFGKYYHKISHAKNIKFFKLFMIIIQVMCLIVNLNIINSLIDNIIITSIIGLIFVMSVYRRGIYMSIQTDVVQYAIMITGVLLIIAMGLGLNSCVGFDFSFHAGETGWLMFSSTVLLLSPICDLQHYQRAEISTRAYTLGAIFFGAYISLVGLASAIDITNEIRIVLIVTMLMATSSTIDSIAVSMHELCSKKIGTLISIILCVAWSLFVNLGILELWNNFGVVRISLAVILILYIITSRRKQN